MKYNFKPIEINIKPGDKVTADELGKQISLPKDPKDRIIEKRGHVVTFTLNQVEENTRTLLKNQKEIVAKRNVEAATMDNIERHHPFIKKLTPEKLFTAWMYQESKGMVDMCDKKLAEIDKQLKEDELEVNEIMIQIPALRPSNIVKEAEEIINE